MINLCDNTVRMNNVRRQLDTQGILFERIEAVFGANLTPAQVSEVYDVAANRTRAKQDFVPGELGCDLSHIVAWWRIVASDAPCGIVLEDDFGASHDLAAVLRALSATDVTDWNIAKLFCSDAAPDLTKSIPLTGGYMLTQPYRVPSTTLGYAITRDSAAALLAHSSSRLTKTTISFWNTTSALRLCSLTL